jgi:transcriptional regulator with XRE-family HTH domain
LCCPPMAGTGKGATPRQRHFGERVRTARAERSMSQEALAHKSGVARAYIGALEAGQRNPSLETICRLAVALGVDAADLIVGCQAKAGRTG